MVEGCEALTHVRCERFSTRAIVAKRSSSPIVMALHVTRTADALNNPYQIKLAHFFRFPFAVQSAIQEAGLGHTEEMRWGDRNYRSGGKQGGGKGGKQEGKARTIKAVVVVGAAGAGNRVSMDHMAASAERMGRTAAATV